jgi:hypothetical protein
MFDIKQFLNKNMEEVKHVCNGEGYHHTCMDMHKFCPKSLCLVRCILIVAVLVGVFAAGYAAGEEGGHERNRGYGDEGYRGGRMMGYGDQNEGYGSQMMQYDNQNEADQSESNEIDGSAQGSRNIQVIYRKMMGQPVAQQPAVTMATGTTQK